LSGYGDRRVKCAGMKELKSQLTLRRGTAMNSRYKAAISRREVLRQAGAAAATAGLLQGAAGPLSLLAFGPDGSPAADDHLNSLLLINSSGRPFELLPVLEGPGRLSIEIPAGKFEIMMVLPVRGFGTVYLYADNAGAFYSGGSPVGEMLLNYEFARSRSAYVRRYVKTAEAEGVAFSAELSRRLTSGEAALARAAAAREVKERAGHSNDSLAETMWAGEMAVLERARHRISRQSARPGFLFGCNAFRFAASEDYAKQYAALLNFATLPFYRARTERVEGSPDYSQAEGILAKIAATGILAKGHPLCWFHRAGVPEFLKKKSWNELKQSCRDYILGTVGRFRSRIHAWDVINEAHDWANDLNLDAAQLIEITRLVSETTRIADPTAFRVVNSCCTWAEYAARRRTYSGPLDRPSRTPLDYVKALEDARVPYDAMGLQIYYPARDMLEIERQMERFFALGKPVHITELGVSSSNEPMGKGENPVPSKNVWHGTEWSEQIQADWVEQFYTICYSRPEVQAITWWDFADPAFIPHGGFLTADLKPKQSYERLQKLLAGWKG
jgi:endo-1,4-beta-xylanase